MFLDIFTGKLRPVCDELINMAFKLTLYPVFSVGDAYVYIQMLQTLEGAGGEES